MKKKKAPEWLRWAYLAVAFFTPFAAWKDFRNYQYYNSIGLFSAERWTEIIQGFQFRWAIQGIMAVSFLYLFIVLTWDKNNDKDHGILDEIFSTVLLLFWACLPLLISLHDSVNGLWALVLAVLIVVVGRSWVKYFENKRLEEEYYE